MSGKRARPVAFTMTTNGTVLSDAHLRFLRHHGFYVSISLDGLPGDHDRHRPFAGGRGSAAVVWRNVARAAAVIDRFSVLLVLNPDTVADVPEAVERLHALGVARVMLLPNADCGWDEAARDRARLAYECMARAYVERRAADRPLYVHPFVERMLCGGRRGAARAEHACGFGRDEVAVAPSGRLYPCARLVGTDTRADIQIGSVHGGPCGERVAAVRRAAQATLSACGSTGSCLCPALMPGNVSAAVERLGFFEQTADRALQTALEGSKTA